MQIVNILNPAAPIPVGNIDLGTTVNDVCQRENYAYVVGSDKLFVIDVSDPANPVLVKTVNHGEGGIELDECRNLTVYNDHLFIRGSNSYIDGYLQSVNISDPLNPTYADNVHHQVGLSGFKLAGIQNMKIIVRPFPATGKVYAYTDGRHTVMPDTYSSISVIDISDPANLLHADSESFINGEQAGFHLTDEIEQEHLFISDYQQSELNIVRATNPANLVYITHFDDQPTQPRLTDGKGDLPNGSNQYLFVCKNDEMHCINITTPTSPSAVSYISDGDEGGLIQLDNPRGMAIDLSRNYVFIAVSNSDCLQIINISSPSSMVHAGRINHGYGGAYLNGASAIFLGNIPFFPVSAMRGNFVGDIKYFYDSSTGKADARMGDRDIIQDQGLETAVLLSIGSDRRAGDDDIIPDGTENKRGWWGDILNKDGDIIGSRRWLLYRSKLTNENIIRLQEYDLEALKWLIDDGVASEVDITITRVVLNAIEEDIKITRPKGDPVTFKYFFNWEAQIAGGT